MGRKITMTGKNAQYIERRGAYATPDNDREIIMEGDEAVYQEFVTDNIPVKKKEPKKVVQEECYQDKVVDAIHELTDVVKESLKKPRNEFKVYPQAGSTANLGCQMQSPEFKVIPPSTEQQPALESRSATKGDACQSKNKEGDEKV